MNRRRFLSLCAGAPLGSFASCAPLPEAAPLSGADPLSAAPPRDPRRCLPNHLRALAARACRIRSRALAELTTAGALRRGQAWVRDTLWKLVGGMPERTPLSTQVLGTLDRPGYRVEKLVYESWPGLHVTANLYLPTGGEGPLPGVLFQMGHKSAGKGAPAYQSACQALVKLGYVVLGFDPVGQGERRPAGSTDAAEDEHDRIGWRMLLAGDTATRLMLWDAVRSLDVLASRPEVDPERLASAGHSGGGTLTMLLAAVDDRLAAAAISCANTEDLAAAGFDPPGAVDDAEQDLVGSGPLGFDRWDLVYPLAPRPLLILVSSADPSTTYSPAYLVNGRAELEVLKRAYTLVGDPDHVRWVETAAPHGLSPERRIEIERWFGRFLGGDALTTAGEPETTPEPEETTWVVPGGDVTAALKGKTPLDLIRERVAGFPASRPRPPLESVLGLVRPGPGRAVAVITSLPMGACVLDDLSVASAPAAQVPAWLFRPEAAPRSVLIVLPPGGRPPRWEDEPEWLDLAREGHAVCVADVRATGALCPELGPGASGYARARGVEASFAWASLTLGESLLAQRVADVLALVEGLARHAPLCGRPLALAAQGPLTVPALFAAALDPRIGLVYLDGGLASYRSVLDAEHYQCPPACILPGVLAFTDLPEVAATASPRRVILAGPVDGQGLPMALAEARALYRDAANVHVRPQRGWDFVTLRAVLEREAAAP